MAKAKDMDSSKSYSNVSSSPTRLPSFQMYDQSNSFSNRWEKENFGEKSQQYMSDNSRKPEDTSLSEYSTSRERYKNELDSKLASEKRIIKPDPKSELIEEEEEEEVEEEIEEEEEEEEVPAGNNLMTNEGKETVRKYFERASADVYTIPEEEDEISSPTCGDGVTSLRRQLVGGRGTQLSSTYTTSPSNSPQQGILSKQNSLQSSLSSTQQQGSQSNNSISNQPRNFSPSKTISFQTSSSNSFQFSSPSQSGFQSTSNQLEQSTMSPSKRLNSSFPSTNNVNIDNNLSRLNQFNQSKPKDVLLNETEKFGPHSFEKYRSHHPETGMTELEFLQAQEEAQKRLNEKNRQFGAKGSPLKQSPFSSSFINQLDKTELEKLKFLESQSQKWQNPDSMNTRLNEQFQSLQNKPMNEYYSNSFGARNSFMDGNFMENEMDEFGFQQNRMSTTKPGTISGMLADFSRALGM
ncbi:hypothetical protein WDU94_009106 [Cyamophila willieti]